jgi:hypothetical protein
MKDRFRLLINNISKIQCSLHIQHSSQSTEIENIYHLRLFLRSSGCKDAIIRGSSKKQKLLTRDWASCYKPQRNQSSYMRKTSVKTTKFIGNNDFFWTSFKALLMSLVRGTDHEKLACSFAAMSYEHLDNFVKWSDEVVGYRRHKAFQICPIKTHILYTSLSVFASTTSSVISYNAQETFPRCGLLILLPTYNTMVNVCNNERGYWCWMTSVLYMNRIHVSEHPLWCCKLDCSPLCLYVIFIC